ncbi:MAG: UvrD-helicase domain-containing protein [Fibrobacter sp.]|nr:UvrD-helicase domain-containing protein [Fibrobacter sp.]
MFSFIKKFFERRKALAEEREKECCNLLSGIRTCQSELDTLFANSAEIVAKDQVASWRNRNQLFIDSLNKKEPKTFSKTSCYTQYKSAWEQFFSALDFLPQKVKIHNGQALVVRKTEAKQIIGNIKGFPLDEQQLECVVTDAHNQLVIAGAGTGKTTTIVGKVKYLLKKKICKPEEILILSFTKKSAEDMNQQLKDNIDVPITACTFHSLGYDKVLGKLEGKRAVFQETGRFVKDQLKEEIKDSKYLKLLVDYLLYNKSKSKCMDDFNSAEEYNQYIADNPPKTINGIAVKSYGEMDIANFLWQNQVAFEYERPYRFLTATEVYRQYQPDFYLPEYDIYIEYFGINRQGKVSDAFSGRNGKSASQVYSDGMRWKRKIHKEHNTKLVECFAYEKFEDTLLDVLKQRLAEQGVVFKPLSAEDMWAFMQDDYDKNFVFQRIASLLGTMLTQAKANAYSIETLHQINKSTKNTLERKENKDILRLFEPIYTAYLNMLSAKNFIDFSDMINNAAKYIREGKYVNPYKVVIVDEYQDISKPRYNLLKALRESSDYKLFCVGDDWQSIYRFAGSDVSYILNFEKYWGPTELGKIETTYRFPKRLIDASGRFVMENPAQIKKQLKTPSKDNSYALGTGLWGWRLMELPLNSSVYFLGRYNDDERMMRIFLKELVPTRNKGEYIYPARKDLSIRFLTVHASKGLQADYVFILNNKNGRKGFPSKIEDAPVMKLFMDNPEEFPYAEERRLYYVAMTRAKKKVVFVPPMRGDTDSCFLKEIKNRYKEDLIAEGWACPICGGQLEKKKGPYGMFLGCRNYQKEDVWCEFTRSLPARR